MMNFKDHSAVKKSQKRSLTPIFGVTVASSIMLTSPSIASAAGGTSPDELLEILRSAKVIPAEAQLRAVVNDKEALVTTTRDAKSTDNACKIRAVLLAKSLFQAFPTQLLRVKVMFINYEESKHSDISISKGDIQAFGSGAMDQKAFLESLELVTKGDSGGVDSATPATADGFMKAERDRLQGHIESLNKRGTNVKAYTQYFQQIEEMVKQGNEAMAKTMIANLEDKLVEQEKAIKQASRLPSRASGSGGGSGNLSQPATAIPVQESQMECFRQLKSLGEAIEAYKKTGKPSPVGEKELGDVGGMIGSGNFAGAARRIQELKAKVRL